MCGRKRSASDCLLKMQTWKLCLEACLETTECVVLNWNKVEAYSVEKEGCPLICRFATMGTVRSIQHSKIGKNPSFLSLSVSATAIVSVHLQLFTGLQTSEMFNKSVPWRCHITNLKFRRLLGDYRGEEQCYLPASLHQLATAGTFNRDTHGFSSLISF